MDRQICIRALLPKQVKKVSWRAVIWPRYDFNCKVIGAVREMIFNKNILHRFWQTNYIILYFGEKLTVPMEELKSNKIRTDKIKPLF